MRTLKKIGLTSAQLVAMETKHVRCFVVTTYTPHVVEQGTVAGKNRVFAHVHGKKGRSANGTGRETWSMR